MSADDVDDEAGADKRTTRWLAAWALFILLLYTADALGGASLLPGYVALNLALPLATGS